MTACEKSGPAIVPLLSSGTAGPLDVVHLPRIWLKAILASSGRLKSGWNVGPDAPFDRMVLETIGLDAAETTAYLLRERPSYLAFEEWIRARVGAPDAATCAKVRDYITQRVSPLAAQRRAELGIDDPSVESSVLLNDLEEWSIVHAEMTTASA